MGKEVEEIKNDDKERNARYKKRSKLRKDIEADLISQLEEKNTIEITFIDMVSDYLSLWDIKNELIHDIQTRGVSQKYQNGANQWGYKKNDCISELNKVNGQMLKILSELGVKAGMTKVVDDDEQFDL